MQIFGSVLFSGLVSRRGRRGRRTDGGGSCGNSGVDLPAKPFRRSSSRDFHRFNGLVKSSVHHFFVTLHLNFSIFDWDGSSYYSLASSYAYGHAHTHPHACSSNLHPRYSPIMQKALRINLLARNNYFKKSRKSLAKTRKGEEKQFEQAQSMRSKILRDQRRAERRDRRDDWISGDLAANRNTGLTKGALGAVHISQMSSREVPRGVLGAPKDLAESNLGWREDWEGEGNEWNIIVGDRVCVVRGVEGVVGQIGVVKDVQPEKGELTVADVNMVCEMILVWVRLMCAG